MIEIVTSATFDAWLRRLRDGLARGRILDAIDRMRDGNFGDGKSVGDGICELRLHFGPGYRIYYMRQGSALVILLNGGDKSSQARDIARAKTIAKDRS